ncbi:unnamed protein product [Ambrosiozyma monospora]|uniref:Unnamed protein product n=1 Tax=Ambrosiozyma monospora TaxID=43982 RepID=A0ACB5SZ47_AMBMO|nr:unnamed protein product [Ambrosiozyma monospora]
MDADEEEIIKIETIFKCYGSLVYADTAAGSVVDVSTQRYADFLQQNFAFMINYKSFEKNNRFWDKLWMKMLPNGDDNGDNSTTHSSGAIISQINIQFLNGPNDVINDSTSLFSKTMTSNDSSTLEMQKLKEAITEAKAKIRTQSNSQSQSQSQRKQQFERELQQPPPFNELHLASLDTTNKKLSIRPTNDPTVMMNDYLDKSWLMGKLFNLEPLTLRSYKLTMGTKEEKENEKSNFLLEFIVCFTIMMVLNNQSCQTQWFTMTSLILQCYELMQRAQSHQSQTQLQRLFLALFPTLKLMLETILTLKLHDPTTTGNNNTNFENDDEHNEQFIDNIKALKPCFKKLIRNTSGGMTTGLKDFKMMFLIQDLIQFVNTKFAFDVGVTLNDSDTDDESEDEDVHCNQCHFEVD